MPSSAGSVAADAGSGPSSAREARGPRARLTELWSKHRRVIQAAGVLLLGSLVLRTCTEGASAGSLEASLAMALERDGIRVETDTVTWLTEDESALSTRAAVFVLSLIHI